MIRYHWPDFIDLSVALPNLQPLICLVGFSKNLEINKVFNKPGNLSLEQIDTRVL